MAEISVEKLAKDIGTDVERLIQQWRTLPGSKKPPMAWYPKRKSPSCWPT